MKEIARRFQVREREIGNQKVGSLRQTVLGRERRVADRDRRLDSAVEGRFGRGEVVACVDSSGREIARGLVNYPAEEVKRLLGQSSDHIEKILGYVAEPELIHRDNMVVF